MEEHRLERHSETGQGWTCRCFFLPLLGLVGMLLARYPQSCPLFRSAERAQRERFPTAVRTARQSKRSTPDCPSCFSPLPRPKLGTQAGPRCRKEGRKECVLYAQAVSLSSWERVTWDSSLVKLRGGGVCQKVSGVKCRRLQLFSKRERRSSLLLLGKSGGSK